MYLYLLVFFSTPGRWEGRLDAICSSRSLNLFVTSFIALNLKLTISEHFHSQPFLIKKIYYNNDIFEVLLNIFLMRKDLIAFTFDTLT